MKKLAIVTAVAALALGWTMSYATAAFKEKRSEYYTKKENKLLLGEGTMSTSFFPTNGYECLDDRGVGVRVCAGLSSLTDHAVFRVEILGVLKDSESPVPYQLCVGGRVLGPVEDEMFSLDFKFVAEEFVPEDPVEISPGLFIYVLTFQGTIFDHPDSVFSSGDDALVTGFIHPFFGIFRKPLADLGYPEVLDCLPGDAAYVSGFPLLRECNDGLDNDGDGFIDFGSDLQCASATDNDESM